MRKTIVNKERFSMVVGVSVSMCTTVVLWNTLLAEHSTLVVRLVLKVFGIA